MYQFTRQRLVIFVACLAVLGFLTYAAGVVTGIGLVMPTKEEIAMLKAAKPADTVAAAPVHLPATPAIPPVAQAAAHPVAAAPAAAPLAQPQAQAPAAVPAEAAAAPVAPPPDAPARIAPSPSLAAKANSDDGFSLQLGSFHDANNAKQLQTDLKDRGYNTSILTALDSDQREWHVVRIDGFKTLDSAAKAAADFTGKERMPALVRRSNGL